MNKKFLGFLIAVIIMLAMSVSVFAISGEGTEENPFLIKTEEDFMIMGDFPTMHYKLNNDITVNSVLGDFSGTLDGNGFTLTTTKEYIFSSNNGSIKNMTVNGGMLATTNNGSITHIATNSGILVHTNSEKGIIKNCKEILTGTFDMDSSLLNHISDQYGYKTISMIVNNYGEITNCSCLYDGATIKKNRKGLSLAGISFNNYGTIQNSSCVYNSTTISVYDNETYPYSCEINVGGIAFYNYNGSTINRCFTTGDLYAKASSDKGGKLCIGGIAYENSGKISKSYYNGSSKLYTFVSEPRCSMRQDFYAIAKNTSNTTSVIENCYSKGAAYSTSGSGITLSTNNFNVLMGGITDSLGYVSNCYTEMNFEYSFNEYVTIYPIGGKVITNSYYSSSSPSTDNSTYGTPKSSAAMKMKLCYTDWDFDTIWAIDPEINDGYPYLQWQYENTEEPVVLDYTINSLTVTDGNDNVLDSIPETGSCYAEISITKNTDRNEKDYLIIAMYNEKGVFIDYTYTKLYNQNHEITFGTLLKTQGIKTLKAFVWDGISSMTPLSNSYTFE